MNSFDEACAAVFARLEALGIPFDHITHEPVWDFADYAPLGARLNAVVLKNLFLTTRRKGGYYLYVTTPDRAFQAGTVSAQAGVSRLCFAPEDALSQRLHTYSGAVSPLGLMFDEKCEVRLLLDSALKACPRLAFHPCRNDRTVVLSQRDFLTVFLPDTGHDYTWVNTSASNAQ